MMEEQNVKAVSNILVSTTKMYAILINVTLNFY